MTKMKEGSPKHNNFLLLSFQQTFLFHLNNSYYSFLGSGRKTVKAGEIRRSKCLFYWGKVISLVKAEGGYSQTFGYIVSDRKI